MAINVCAAEEPAPSDKISFNDDIRPILNQHCVACHGGVKQAGGLSFVFGDEASYVVEPGEPDESYIIQRVRSDDPEEHMPPAEHGPPLSDEDVAKLRQWIVQGGDWGRHWAFVAPQKIEPPKSSKPEYENWARTRTDAFVLNRLEQAGLAPEQDAEPERWLRRATLDLTGLPPTLKERRQFLKAVDARGEAAYAEAATRLLDSASFGERWASVWLDAMRYADSKGLGIDGRRTIWKYRDWVIKAFNADMPFDEFTLKQLAGDLLPDASINDMVATACNRLTQTCEEGGTDDEQFRTEAVIDRVNTTMLAWQGLTFGCVQCHSHPYDPIQHEEYYQVLAFFNNTADSDLDNDEPLIRVPLEDKRIAEATELDRAVDAIKVAQWQAAYDIVTGDDFHWQPLQDFSASTNNTTQVVTERVDEFTEYQTRGTVAKETTVLIESALPESLQSLVAFRFTGLPKDLEQAAIDSEWGFVLSHVGIELLEDGREPKELKIVKVVADDPHMLVDPQLSLNAKSNQGFGAYSRIHYPRSAVFVLDEAVEVGPESTLRVSLKQNVFALGAFPLVAHRGRLEVTNDSRILKHLSQPLVQQQSTELTELEKRRDAIQSVSIPVMRERSKQIARPTFVFDRGNYLTKSERVAAQTPEFLPELGTAVPDRLDFARWLAHADNPLTARVTVNRFWGQMFGQGLVLSQEDFGSSGDAPSHPDLLDDLAARFASDMKWSVKTLLREIVLSSTYRQASTAEKEKRAIDPNNRLLSRGPRHRLPAETIRDQALAISGLLNPKQFGEPVHPPIPDGVWQPFQGGDKWKTPEVGDPERYRKTIYTYTKRTIQFPMLASFDAPTREFCSPRRLPSNTPLQALMTLNDATFVEAAEALAKRMLAHSDTPNKQIRHGFLLATSRFPGPKERRQLLTLYESQTTDLDEDSDSAKLRALGTVATVLLNLDEVLNK